MKLIEFRDTRRFNRQTFDEKYMEWVKEMKKLLPTDYRFLGLPMFFNYCEPEKIRSLVIENAESFYLVNLVQQYNHFDCVIAEGENYVLGSRWKDFPVSEQVLLGEAGAGDLL